MQPNGTLRLVYAAPRALTDTEQRYATIEQEALAIVWACEQFRNYIIDMTVSIQTDHKPLIFLFSDTELSKMPAGIQWFVKHISRFQYRMEHIAEK